MTECEKSQKENHSKATLMQILLGLMTNLSNLSLGAALGFSAIALPAMKNAPGLERIDDTQASWIASTTSIAIPIGCLISGPLLDNLGRKVTLYAVNVVSLLGWIFIATASREPGWQYAMLLTGRVITGVATGLGSIPATIYLSEISTPELRGMLATWTSVFVAIGVLVIYVLGYFLQESWRTAAYVATSLTVLSFGAIYFFMPESPSWLVNRGKIEAAEKSLSKIRCIGITSPKLKEEIETLVANKIKNKDNLIENGSSFSRKCARNINYFFKPVCLKPFIIMVTYFFFQQASGTFVIVFYAVDIVKEAGVSIDPYLAAILIALSRVIASILVGMICKTYGRRPPSIVSGASMTICMVVLAGYLYSIKLGKISPETETQLNWLPVSLVILYFFMSTLGFLTIPFAMIAEVFPTRARGFAGGLTACLCYTFNFVFVKNYDAMIGTMGKYGVFGFYGGMSLLGTVFVVMFLPETKGKTLQEIEEHFGRGRRRGRRPEKKELQSDVDV